MALAVTSRPLQSGDAIILEDRGFWDAAGSRPGWRQVRWSDFWIQFDFSLLFERN